MEGWRRQGDNFNQEGTRTTRPLYKRPPLGSWQQTVPAWEKKFCTSVGSVPWRKILETKKCMHLYDNVVQWNDSAGAEAFQNAKNRFYANFHGLSCDISMPDPNLYIDEIDWDSKMDPDLISDLESRSVVSVIENNERVIIFGNALIANQGFSSTGWGDTDDDLKKPPNPTTEINGLKWDSNQGQNNGPTEGNRWEDYGYNNNTWCWTNNNAVQGFSSTGWGDNEDDVKKPPNPTTENNAVQWDSNQGQNNDPTEGNRWGDYEYNNNTWYWTSNNTVQGFSSTGWGDNEDDVKPPPNPTTENNTVQWDSNQGQNNGPTEGNGWGDYEYNNNTWCWTDSNGTEVDSGWGDNWNNGWEHDWNNYWGWRQYGNNNYVIDNVNGSIDGGWREMNNSRRDGSGRYMSRYRTSRFREEDNQGNHYSWRNGKGNGRKHMNATYVPVHRASGLVAHQWS